MDAKAAPPTGSISLRETTLGLTVAVRLGTLSVGCVGWGVGCGVGVGVGFGVEVVWWVWLLVGLWGWIVEVGLWGFGLGGLWVQVLV